MSMCIGKRQTPLGSGIVQLGVTADGNGWVATENGKGGTLVTLSATTEGGVVTTENGKGTITSQSP